jgi:hypothetical protein
VNMRKLFSGNADVVAVFAVVLTLGLASGVGHGFSRVRQMRDHVLTRVPPKMRRPALKLRFADWRESHLLFQRVICKR